MAETKTNYKLRANNGIQIIADQHIKCCYPISKGNVTEMKYEFMTMGCNVKHS